MVLCLAHNRHWINIYYFLMFHLSSRQILILLCVSQTGLPCLSPTNPNCHPESSKKYTLPRKQYKLAHRFFFTPCSMISKCSKKKQSQSKFPLCTPTPPHPRTHTWTFKPWKSDERERPAFHCFTSCIYTEFTSQTQGAQSEVPWAKFVLCLNSDFCLPRQ